MVRTQRTYETHRRIKNTRRRIGDGLECSQFDPIKIVEAKKDSDTPQLNLLLKAAPHYERSLPFPYEILLKIFHHVVELSDHPLKDMCSLARVCETWRILVVTTPTLWTRINLKKIPLTDGNFRALNGVIQSKEKIIDNIRELSLKGPMRIQDAQSSNLLERIIAAPNLDELYMNKLDPQTGSKFAGRIIRAIGDCKRLRVLSIRNTKFFFNNQKWLADYLVEHGTHLEELYLTSSMITISPQLFRSLGSDFCPSLRVLDLSTCDFLNTHTFDALLLTETMPNLKVLRAANVSFRRVRQVPDYFGLCKLEELSMPIAMRDADRDDALLATLTYGSDNLRTLDLRGSSVSAHALLDMPSNDVRVLHIDDICPLTRKFYGNIIAKWQHSLEVLSLVKINCSETINDCLKALISDRNTSNIREIDLQASEVTPSHLRKFLSSAKTLKKIDTSACRSLPRGCKGVYSPNDTMSVSYLKQKLGTTNSDSETEIEEDYLDLGPSLSRKRRRVTKKLVDYVYSDYLR